MTDVDTLKMTNLDKTKWIRVKTIRLFDAVPININGIKVSIMDPRDLVTYKKELGGEHQLVDVEAVKKYIAEHKI